MILERRRVDWLIESAGMRDNAEESLEIDHSFKVREAIMWWCVCCYWGCIHNISSSSGAGTVRRKKNLTGVGEKEKERGAGEFRVWKNDNYNYNYFRPAGKGSDVTREGQCKRAMQKPCIVLERDAHQMTTSSQGNWEKFWTTRPRQIC